jgi:hypothetical protein
MRIFICLCTMFAGAVTTLHAVTYYEHYGLVVGEIESAAPHLLPKTALL